MNAVLGGILLGSTILVAIFSLEGSVTWVVVGCLWIAFVGGLVGAGHFVHEDR